MSELKPADSCNSPASHPHHYSQIVAVMGVAIVAGVLCQQWLFSTEERSFTGQYRLETYSIQMPYTGTIKAWRHEAGSEISNGEELVVIANQSLQEQIESTEHELELLAQKMNSLEARAGIELAQLVRELDEERFAIQSNLATYHQQKFDQELKVVALNDLLQESPRVASRENSIDFFAQPRTTTAERESEKIKIQLEQQTAQNAVESCDVLIEMCSARLNELNLRKAELSKQSRDALGLQELQIRQRQLQKHLDQLKQKSKATTLKAPGTGLLVIPAGSEAGKEIQAQAELAQIVDQEQAYLLIHVPSSKISWLELNSEVTVHFSDVSKAQGVVESISDRAISLSEQSETFIPVKIRPFGKAWPRLPLNATVRISLQ